MWELFVIFFVIWFESVVLLQDSLDDYCMTEFWYVDRGIVIAEKDNLGGPKLSFRRQEEKWWLPTPKVPVNGLSDKARRQLQHQRECMNQILKAAMSINEQVLSEMEVPQVYWDSLPKVGFLLIHFQPCMYTDKVLTHYLC